jgi:hypothetical protein
MEAADIGDDWKGAHGREEIVAGTDGDDGGLQLAHMTPDQRGQSHQPATEQKQKPRFGNDRGMNDIGSGIRVYNRHQKQ